MVPIESDSLLVIQGIECSTPYCANMSPTPVKWSIQDPPPKKKTCRCKKLFGNIRNEVILSTQEVIYILLLLVLIGIVKTQIVRQGIWSH